MNYPFIPITMFRGNKVHGQDNEARHFTILEEVLFRISPPKYCSSWGSVADFIHFYFQ